MQRRRFVILPLAAGIGGCAQTLITPAAAPQAYTQVDLDRNVDEFLRGDVKRARSSQFVQILRSVEFDIQYLVQNILISNVKVTLDPGPVNDVAAEHVKVQARQIREMNDFFLTFRITSDDDKTEFATGAFDRVNRDKRTVAGSIWSIDLGQRKLVLPLKFSPPRDQLLRDPNYFRIWAYVSAVGANTSSGAGSGPSLFNHYLRPL
jgi:hypothetical protein